METSVALLTLSLIYLNVAEAQQLDTRAGQGNSKYIPEIKPPSPHAGDIIGSCETCCQLGVILRELEAKLKNTEKQLVDLKGVIQGDRVGFGASLGNVGDVGPCNTEITLTYRNVFSNTGAYKPTTGIFTAPLKGLYYFSFTGHGSSVRPMGLQLMKNGKQMFVAYNHPAGNRYETVSNSMTLQLEVGDQVYIALRQNTWTFDNTDCPTTFNGHLLFRL